MRVHLSGSGLAVNYSPLLQRRRKSGSSGVDSNSGAESAYMAKLQLLCCCCVTWLVVFVMNLRWVGGRVTYAVANVMRRFDVVVESVVLRGCDIAWCSASVYDIVAGVIGVLVVLTFLVEGLASSRGAMCDVIIVAMGLAMVTEPGGIPLAVSVALDVVPGLMPNEHDRVPTAVPTEPNGEPAAVPTEPNGEPAAVSTELNACQLSKRLQ
jgi:hypothetical protein